MWKKWRQHRKDRQRARREREKEIRRSFHNDPEAACAAYYLFNTRSLGRWRSFDRDMIRRAVEFDYLNWPRKIAADVQGKDMLDVGCGTGLHAIGFLVVGVKSYTGMDPLLEMDSDLGYNMRKQTSSRNNRPQEHFGWTAAEIQRRLPRVRLVPGTFEQVAPDKTFDVAVLHNVTEHLLHIEEVFKGVWRRLRPDGACVFNHHNYYSWNGHHQPPKFVDEISADDPEQRKFLDWNHLDLEAETAEVISKELNRIRLDELRALSEKYFTIEDWKETPSDSRRGGGRLTDEIRRRFPQYSDREFTTQNVLCRARKRAVPLDQ